MGVFREEREKMTRTEIDERGSETVEAYEELTITRIQTHRTFSNPQGEVQPVDQ